MAIQEQQLGQLRPANTTAASLYSPASGETAIIKSIYVCNTTTAVALARVFVDDDGTTYDEGTAIAWDISIEPGQAIDVVDAGFIAMNDATGNLAVRTDTADALTFTAFGAVIT